MKKSSYAIIIILVICIGLVSCQKTPKERIVVDRSGGLPQESIIPREKNKVPKDLGIPEHWKETIVRNDGFITLNADYDIKIPDIYNTPVYSYEIQTISQDYLEKLCAYFSDGDPLYEDPEMTKSELNEEKERAADGKGNWRFIEPNYITAMIGRIENLIPNAPEQKAERKYIDARFRAPQKAGMENIGKTWVNATHKMPWYEWYYETDKKIGFTARIDRGKEVNPIVRAINYDDDVGSTTAFVYRPGTFIDENELELEWAYENVFHGGKEEYLNYLSNEIEQMKDESFTKEDALKEAVQVLADLDIKGMAVAECVKAIGQTESESWAGVGTDDAPLSAGYAVYLSRQAGDVVGFPLTFTAMPYESLAETMYAPSFQAEGIRIIVTKEGIQLFEWTDISKQKDLIAENTKLLPFDKIKERLADHLLYTQVAALGGISQEGFTNIYTVKDVQLRAANINAYEDAAAAWLVPVWIVDVDHVMIFKTDEETTEGNLNPETVVLNAIDGGFVQVHIDW